MIFFAAAAINPDNTIAGVALSQMPPEDALAQNGARLVGIGAIICKPLPTQRDYMSMALDIINHVEMVDGAPRFKDSVKRYVSQVIYHDAITESEVRAAIEEGGPEAIHSVLAAWIDNRLSPSQKAAYGAEFTPSDRAKSMAHKQLLKWVVPDESPTGFQIFERGQVAAVQQDVAANAAWREMTAAVTDDTTEAGNG